MSQRIELTLGKFIMSMLLVLMVPSGAFVATTMVTTAQLEIRTEMLEKEMGTKVNNDVLMQYVKLLNERQATQEKINTANGIDMTIIEAELDRINEEIHKLEMKYIGYESFRGQEKRWDYEKLLCFAWKNGIYFN